MSDYFVKSLGKHKRIIILAVAVAVLTMYMVPFDHLGVLAGKSAGNALAGTAGQAKKGDNNCENQNNNQGNQGQDQDDDNYGCLKH